MLGLPFITLALVSIISTTDGLRPCCWMPCTGSYYYQDKTECPPGFRCKLNKDLKRRECVRTLEIHTCYQPGMASLFNGHVSKTRTGITCQRWDATYPHKPHSSLIYGAHFPEKSVKDANNYCRDPNNNDGRPWCYTTDPKVRWDYCDIPLCANRNCYIKEFAHTYLGTTGVGNNGDSCVRWDSVNRLSTAYKFQDKSVSAAENCCRSFKKTQTPWCYTSTSKRWRYCEIEQCSFRYCYTKESWLYIGTKAETQSGLKCQDWTSQYPHTHKFSNMPMKFPEGDVKKAKNYCRDPSWSGRPWCYTTDKRKRWDWCCVDKCTDFS